VPAGTALAAVTGMRSQSISFVALLALAPACDSADLGDDDDVTDPSDPDAGLPEVPDDTTALLAVHTLDIWGQPLPAETSLSITRDGSRVDDDSAPLAYVPMADAAAYQVTVTATDHVPLSLDLLYDGSGALDGLTSRGTNDPGHGLAIRRDLQPLVDGKPPVPVYTVYIGVRHRWFSAAGRPARRGNDVRLLMDGEQAWSSVYSDLTAATDSVLFATWWWESDFELIREGTEHIGLSDGARNANTILGVLDRIPAVKRVIVGQFLSQDGLLDWATTDAPLRARGDAAGDGFEFMGQANETAGMFRFEVEPFVFGDRVRATRELSDAGFDAEQPIASTVPGRDVDLTDWPIDVSAQHASYHQKFAVIDSSVAYIGGMNLRRVDWDSSDHRVFDHRRMLFDASTADRWDVYDGEALPDSGPRKDYMIRIEGPAAQDAADVFKRRWDLLLYEEADYSENASAFEVDRDIADAGGIQVQVTPTLPDPLWEHAIIETWYNAVRNAEDYIFIEDQYFRIPMLNDAIVERMNEVPSLRLLVVTKPVNEWTDPGCEWTHASDTLFETQFPGRYMTIQLRAFDTQVTWGFDETESRFQDIDVHSKLLIVDDVFLSVGSANKNNRGAIYEGEMNAAVVDATWVRDARRRIFANMLPPGTAPTNDADTWWRQFADAANWNGFVYDNWDDEGWDISLDGDPLPASYTPSGFVYPLEFRTVDDCFFEGVGPDVT
jgi:phosphatidylserine/phosphatidylglycerophosphate/cardiolipin synthase-like enzyme